uniref:EGF-like domain-containing protein n=1 Tax=Strongyloides venezuelensis TaxID=75913 RepID=A0A0K0FNN8_STRVS
MILIILFVSISFVQCRDIRAISIKDEPPYPVSRGTPLSKNLNLICINGHKMGVKCVCKAGFSGEFCQNKMYCQDFNRTSDGSCEACMENYEGNFCDTPICKHGTVDKSVQKCNCTEPYSGEFCNKFVKADVLLFHNQKMRSFGPLGFLFIIPMALIYYCCEKDSEKRKVQRYAKILEGEEFEVSHKAVKNILNEK